MDETHFSSWQEALCSMRGQMLCNVYYNRPSSHMNKPLDFVDRILGSVTLDGDDVEAIGSNTVEMCAILLAAYLRTGRFKTSPTAFDKLSRIIVLSETPSSVSERDAKIAVVQTCARLPKMGPNTLRASIEFIAQMCTRNFDNGDLNNMTPVWWTVVAHMAMACVRLPDPASCTKPMMTLMQWLRDSMRHKRASQVREAASVILRLVQSDPTSHCVFVLKSSFLALDMGREIAAWLKETHRNDRISLCTDVVIATIVIARANPMLTTMYTTVLKCIARDLVDTVYTILTSSDVGKDKEGVEMEEAMLNLVLQVVARPPSAFEPNDPCLLQPFIDQKKVGSWSHSMDKYMVRRHEMGGCTADALASWIKIYIALLPHMDARPDTIPSITVGMNDFIDDGTGSITFTGDVDLSLVHGESGMVSSHVVGFFMLMCTLMPPITKNKTARVMNAQDVASYMKSIWTLLQVDSGLPIEIKHGFLAGPLHAFLQDPFHYVLQFLMTPELSGTLSDIARSVGERLRVDMVNLKEKFQDESVWPHVKMRMIFGMRIISIVGCREIARDLAEMAKAQTVLPRIVGRTTSTVHATFIKNMEDCSAGKTNNVSRGFQSNMAFLRDHLMDTYTDIVQDLSADVHNGVTTWLNHVASKSLTSMTPMRDVLDGVVPKTDIGRCASCDAEDACFVCGACECVRYCGVECQKRGWKHHDHRHKCLAKLIV